MMPEKLKAFDNEFTKKWPFVTPGLELDSFSHTTQCAAHQPTGTVSWTVKKVCLRE